MQNYLTVSSISKYLKYKFDSDEHLKNIDLQGEISNFKRNSRGHFYFTLKDSESQISATMFSFEASKVDFEPKDGQTVVVRGSVSTYIPYGTYSINVTKMEIQGVGDLFLAYEKLKAELEEKGYFSSANKKPIPSFPTAIAIITSPTGAAVRDCINTISRRYPLAKIYVYPAIVQGDDSKFDIVRNIEAANKDKLVDTIILGRGGGSIEDLWAFNEKIVAEAIFASDIPIISAVGHETDFTISDFVADVRAATPTAAAELATPDIISVKNYIKTVESRLGIALNSKVDSIKQTVLNLDRRLDNLNPKIILEKIMDKKIHLDELLQSRVLNIIENKYNIYKVNLEKLNALNPLLIMDKGFSLVKKGDMIVRSVKDVSTNDVLELNLKDGIIKAKVI